MNENLPFKLNHANDNNNLDKESPSNLKLLTFQPEQENAESFYRLLRNFIEKCEGLLYGENLSKNYNSIFLSTDRNILIVNLVINAEFPSFRALVDESMRLINIIDNTNAKDHKLFLLLQIFIHLYTLKPAEVIKSVTEAKLEVILDFYREFLKISNGDEITILMFRQIIINARLCILDEIKARKLDIPKVKRGFNLNQSKIQDIDYDNVIPFFPRKGINKNNYIKILEEKYKKFESSLKELFREKYDNVTYQEYLLSSNDYSDVDLLQVYIECEEFLNLL